MSGQEWASFLGVDATNEATSSFDSTNQQSMPLDSTNEQRASTSTACVCEGDGCRQGPMPITPMPFATAACYGDCPSTERIVMVQCTVCTMWITPIGYNAHMARRHRWKIPTSTSDQADGKSLNGTLEDRMTLPLLDISTVDVDDFDAVLLSPTVLRPFTPPTKDVNMPAFALEDESSNDSLPVARLRITPKPKPRRRTKAKTRVARTMDEIGEQAETTDKHDSYTIRDGGGLRIKLAKAVSPLVHPPSTTAVPATATATEQRAKATAARRSHHKSKSRAPTVEHCTKIVADDLYDMDIDDVKPSSSSLANNKHVPIYQASSTKTAMPFGDNNPIDGAFIPLGRAPLDAAAQRRLNIRIRAQSLKEQQGQTTSMNISKDVDDRAVADLRIGGVLDEEKLDTALNYGQRIISITDLRRKDDSKRRQDALALLAKLGGDSLATSEESEMSDVEAIAELVARSSKRHRLVLPTTSSDMYVTAMKGMLDETKVNIHPTEGMLRRQKYYQQQRQLREQREKHERHQQRLIAHQRQQQQQMQNAQHIAQNGRSAPPPMTARPKIKRTLQSVQRQAPITQIQRQPQPQTQQLPQHYAPVDGPRIIPMTNIDEPLVIGTSRSHAVPHLQHQQHQLQQPPQQHQHVTQQLHMHHQQLHQQHVHQLSSDSLNEMMPPSLMPEVDVVPTPPTSTTSMTNVKSNAAPRLRELLQSPTKAQNVVDGANDMPILCASVPPPPCNGSTSRPSSSSTTVSMGVPVSPVQQQPSSYAPSPVMIPTEMPAQYHAQSSPHQQHQQRQQQRAAIYGAMSPSCSGGAQPQHPAQTPTPPMVMLSPNHEFNRIDVQPQQQQQSQPRGQPIMIPQHVVMVNSPVSQQQQQQLLQQQAGGRKRPRLMQPQQQQPQLHGQQQFVFAQVSNTGGTQPGQLVQLPGGGQQYVVASISSTAQQQQRLPGQQQRLVQQQAPPPGYQFVDVGGAPTAKRALLANPPHQQQQQLIHQQQRSNGVHVVQGRAQQIGFMSVQQQQQQHRPQSQNNNLLARRQPGMAQQEYGGGQKQHIMVRQQQAPQQHQYAAVPIQLLQQPQHSGNAQMRAQQPVMLVQYQQPINGHMQQQQQPVVLMQHPQQQQQKFVINQRGPPPLVRMQQVPQPHNQLQQQQAPPQQQSTQYR